MLFSWLANKLFKGRKESADSHTQRIWAEWDTRRMAAEETGQPFDETQPEQPQSGRKRRWRRGRPSALDAGAAGATGAFLVGPPIDHGHGHHGHGGFDGGFHGGGGDAGGGGF